MDKNESLTLNIVRFIMMLAVVFFHGYTSVQMYNDIMAMPVYHCVIKIFGLQFGELGVPVFFAISGYLFFYGYKQNYYSYHSKLKRRIFSLLIPYFFWNVFFLMVFYIVEFIPLIRDLFNQGRELVHDYTGYDFFKAFWAEDRTGKPFQSQLWFVRNLMVLMVCSPFIYYLINKGKSFLIMLLAIIWYFGAQWYNEVNSVFFFSFGAYFSMNGKSLVGTINLYRRFIVLFFILLALLDLFLMYDHVNHWIHRAVLLVGPPFVIIVTSWMVERGIIRDIKFLTASIFFVYVVHDPMLRFIRKFSLQYIDHESDWQLIIGYFSAIFMDLVICYILYWLLSRYAPRLLVLISGGRG